MPTALDLFSGCGGFALGARRAGLKTALAVDIDPILSSSFETNFPGSKLHLGDVTKLTKPVLRSLLPAGVDAIIGGAPCQAFSEIGSNELDDPRRKLVRQFFRVVAAVDPAVFIFENVRGLNFEKNIDELNAGLKALPSNWVTFGPSILDAADFGAPTKRKRLFVFGFNKKKATIPKLDELTAPTRAKTTVRDAIADLADATEEATNLGEFAQWRYRDFGSLSVYAKDMRARSGVFTGHAKTKHTATTLARFASLLPGGVDAVGRYPRLKWDGLCPTLRAGTGSDRGSYQAVRPVHPEEDRVITPREAARLQGFPDDFLFHPTVWHSCRMIGNSVSPIIAEELVRRVLNGAGLVAAPEPIAAE